MNANFEYDLNLANILQDMRSDASQAEIPENWKQIPEFLNAVLDHVEELRDQGYWWAVPMLSLPSIIMMLSQTKTAMGAKRVVSAHMKYGAGAAQMHRFFPQFLLEKTSREGSVG